MQNTETDTVITTKNKRINPALPITIGLALTALFLGVLIFNKSNNQKQEVATSSSRNSLNSSSISNNSNSTKSISSISNLSNTTSSSVTSIASSSIAMQSKSYAAINSSARTSEIVTPVAEAPSNIFTSNDFPNLSFNYAGWSDPVISTTRNGEPIATIKKDNYKLDFIKMNQSYHDISKQCIMQSYHLNDNWVAVSAEYFQAGGIYYILNQDISDKGIGANGEEICYGAGIGWQGVVIRDTPYVIHLSQPTGKMGVNGETTLSTSFDDPIANSVIESIQL